MFISKKYLDRRTFLQGMGATVVGVQASMIAPCGK